MKTKFLLFIALFFVINYKTIAQVTDEDAIRQTIKMETDARLKGDTTAWKNFFVQDEKTTFGSSGSGYQYNLIGWQNISPLAADIYNQRDSTNKYRFADANFIINESSNLATIEHDRHYIVSNDTLTSSHEYITLVKVNNSWKFVTFFTVDLGSYTNADSGTIENNLNATGYQLLNAKKYNDAIEVLMLNVKLFPKSWNVYDSLGEAYADNKNKSEAIKNYEMSVKINPKNDSGRQKLEKLKNNN